MHGTIVKQPGWGKTLPSIFYLQLRQLTSHTQRIKILFRLLKKSKSTRPEKEQIHAKHQLTYLEVAIPKCCFTFCWYKLGKIYLEKTKSNCFHFSTPAIVLMSKPPSTSVDYNSLQDSGLSTVEISDRQLVLNDRNGSKWI